MDFTFKIDGLDKFEKATLEMQGAVRREVLIALDASGRHVVAEAKRSILTGQKTGRTYIRRTVAHQASAPGEAPASDTGRLVNSITSHLIRDGFYTIIEAGRGVVKYASMLEFGTRNMAARPFFFPSIERSRGWIQNRLNEAITRAIKKGK